MKKHFAMFAFVILILGLSAPSLFAQASGTIKGVCKDAQGNPIADGVVQLVNQDNGQKYNLKTNKKLFHINGYQVTLDENTLDFDLKKEQEKTAQGQGLTPEQLKQKQEAEEKAKKENNTVKTLNEKLAAAKAASDSGDFDTAIADLTAANEIDSTRDLIWFKLGDAYRMSAPKQTDRAEKQKRLDSAVDSYQKAVQLKQNANNQKDPNATKTLAA